MLDEVRRTGDWEAWLRFFLEGVHTTAAGAVETAQRLQALFAADHDRIRQRGRMAGSALRVHQALRQRPIITLSDACRRTELSFPAAASGMKVLTDLGVAKEITGKRRNRAFAYERYVSILSEVTEPR